MNTESVGNQQKKEANRRNATVGIRASATSNVAVRFRMSDSRSFEQIWNDHNRFIRSRYTNGNRQSYHTAVDQAAGSDLTSEVAECVVRRGQ